jgi:PAS domain S-box-containing protein
MELEKKDGSIIVELMNIDQIKIESKDYLFATGRNITERKQAEETLRLEKVNFRHSLDDSPLGVRIATIEGNTIYANKALLNFYGYDSLEELQKTPLKKRYTSESYAEAQKRKHQRERSDLNATDYEISINRKNGEIHHLQVFRKEVLWDGLRQFQIIYNDITERLQAEDEIRKSKKLLEDLNKHLNETRENERASISREIHDQIGQSLTALKLDLNQMHKYINSNPEAETKLESMVGLISGTIKDVQRISSDLRPGILDELGLVSAIEWYCDEFEKRTGIKCNLKFDDSDYSDSQINLTFFRVLQETLTNVIRHAKASDVKVTLHKTLKGTILVIKDNGIGIPGDKIDSNQSLGLISMRERVRQFKGTIDIISKQGKGTKLTFFIPL